MSLFPFYLLLACLVNTSRLADAVSDLKRRQLADPVPINPVPMDTVPMAPTFFLNSGDQSRGRNRKSPARDQSPNRGLPPGRTQGCKSDRTCNLPSDQIVFPNECGNVVANNEITAFLKGKAQDGKVHISMDNGCPGVFVWLVKLAPNHIQEVLKLPGVRGVEMSRPLKVDIPEKVSDANLEDPLSVAYSDIQPNDEQKETTVQANDAQQEITPQANDSSSSWIPDDSSSPQSSSKGSIADGNADIDLNDITARSQRSRLDRRSTTVFREQQAPPHLVFISTPVARSNTKEVDYLYPESTYDRRVTIYSIDSGVEWRHEDFRLSRVIKKWLYSADLMSGKTTSDTDGHGTCVLSVTCGLRNGVFKDPDVVVVKLSFTSGSLLTALQTVVNDLIAREKAPNSGPLRGSIKGYTVIAIQSSVAGAGPVFVAFLKNVLRTLINRYAVVIVVTAGNDAPYVPYIEDYPEVLGNDFPIIVTGAVDLADGEMSDYSQTGPQLTVGAPGSVQCASYLSEKDDTVLKTGTSVASAAAAGLVAAFLNDPIVGDLLRKSSRGVVAAVKACMIELAQPRGSSRIKSIWNGINFQKRDENYGWPPTNLKCFV